MTHDHDRGLSHDLSVLAGYAARRRALLKWGLGLSALPLLACAGSSLSETDADDSSGAAGADGTDTGTAGTASSDGACKAVIPQETAGPYPGDGTNGKNA